MVELSRKEFLLGAGASVALASTAAAKPAFAATAASAPAAAPQDYVAPRMGAFAEPPIAGFFEFNAGDMLPTASYFGLPQGESWLYTFVRGKGGNENALLTTFSGGTASGMMMRVEDFKNPKSMERLDPRSAKFMKGGHVQFDNKDGDLMITGMDYSAMSSVPPMSVKIGQKEFSWVEPDVIDLKGTILGPGMHHFMPWRDAHAKLGGTYYVSVLYRVSGTLFGEEVDGFAGIDQSYQPQGVGWAEGMEAGRDQALWGIWAQELDDGTIQYGQFSRGLGTFNFAVVSDGGRRYSSAVVKADATMRTDGTGYMDRATFHLANGEQWEFVNRVGEVTFDAFGFRSQTGQMRKVGDKRKTKAWYCIFESFPNRLKSLGYK